MPTLDLIYFQVVIGEAIIDDEDSRLRACLWHIEVPRRVRRLASGRSDITLSLLRESPEQLKQCRAHTNVAQGCTVRLTHAVLRPELVKLIAEGDTDEVNLTRIRELSSSVKRVICLNDNRLDCRKENLREVL